MDLIPKKLTQQQPSARRSSSDGAGRGMEFAIVLLAFLGLGYVLDRAFDTKPVFMIVLVVLSLIGQFASMWYGYDARMRELEAEREAATRVRKDVKT